MFVKAMRVFVKSKRVHVKAVIVLVEAVRALVYPVKVPLEALILFQKRESVCRGPFDVKKIETKVQTFGYRSLGSKRNQNVFMCSSIFLAKAKRFYLFKKFWNKIKTF